jgi:ankyrin repeat protein
LQALLRRVVLKEPPDRPILKLGPKARIVWMKEKSRLQALRKQLQSIKLSLIGVIQARNSVNITKICLRLEGVGFVQPHPSTELDSDNDSGLEPEILSTVQSNRDIAKQLFHVREEGTFLLHASTSGCPRWCSCLCHRRTHLQSPQLLNDLLGALSVNFTGIPYISVPCNEKMCKPRTSATARLTYQFPSWLLSRALTLLVDANRVNGPEMQLRTLRVIPSNSPIFRMALAGDVEGMKSLFSQGKASIWDIDSTRWSILHKAFINDQPKVCKFLLKQGADTSIEATNGTTVIERAWHFERTKTGYDDSGADTLFQILKEADIDVLIETQQYSIIHKIVLGLSNLDLANQLEHSTAMIDDVDSKGRTALWWASARGDSESVKILLEHNANIEAGPTSHSALHVAQNADCVRALLAHGANIDCRDEQHRTPLHACAYRGTGRGGSIQLLECLLDHGADIHARTYAGHTPLHYAARYGWLEHAKLLVSRGSQIDAKKATGRTPLMEVVGCSHVDSSRFVDIARFLVQTGADLGSLNTNRRNILHLSAERADSRMMHGLATILLEDTDHVHLDNHAVDAFGARPKDILEHRIKDMAASAADVEELRTAFGDLLEAVVTKSARSETTSSDVTGSASDEEDVFEDAQG